MTHVAWLNEQHCSEPAAGPGAPGGPRAEFPSEVTSGTPNEQVENSKGS